jgi:integrase
LSGACVSAILLDTPAQERRMNEGGTVFAQLMEHASHHQSRRCVERYRGNARVRRFRCWDQFLCMVFGQLTYQLQWADIDLEAGTIRWRADTDKKGYEGVYPISEAARSALATWRRANPAVGAAWVFPAPRNPSKPCDRHLLDDWLRKAYKLAGLTPPKGGM